MPRYPVVNLGQLEVPFSKVEKARRERREKAQELARACRNARDYEAEARGWSIRYDSSGIVWKDEELRELSDAAARKGLMERDRCRKITAMVADLDRWLSTAIPSVMLDLPPRGPLPLPLPPLGPPVASVDLRFRPAAAPVPMPVPAAAPVPTVEEEGRAPAFRRRIPTLPFGNLFTGGGMGPVTYSGG
jgi:hypothetical protein